MVVWCRWRVKLRHEGPELVRIQPKRGAVQQRILGRLPTGLHHELRAVLAKGGGGTVDQIAVTRGDTQIDQRPALGIPIGGRCDHGLHSCDD